MYASYVDLCLTLNAMPRLFVLENCQIVMNVEKNDVQEYSGGNKVMCFASRFFFAVHAMRLSAAHTSVKIHNTEPTQDSVWLGDGNGRARPTGYLHGLAGKIGRSA
jgi:hypothetical protein